MKLPKGKKKPDSGKSDLSWYDDQMPRHMRDALTKIPKTYKPPENCSWCIHRRRDHETKHEVETCAIHGHEIPKPFGEVVEDVPGCDTCVARWCPQFEGQPFAENPFVGTGWFQRWIEEGE